MEESYKALEPPWSRLEASQEHLETSLKEGLCSDLRQSSFLKDVCSEITIWSPVHPPVNLICKEPESTTRFVNKIEKTELQSYRVTEYVCLFYGLSCFH